jgi:hypothetical protein
MGKYLDVRQELWGEEFSRSLHYENYLAASDPAHAAKWRAMEGSVSVPPDRADVVRGFERKLNVLVYSGVWCGDCVRQGPMLARIAGLSDRVDLRFREREDGCRLGEELRMNGAWKVPVVVFLSEDFYELGRFGDRLLTVYRKMAREKLGPSCSTGLVPPPADEFEAETREWVDVFERMHIILRLSPMLRERYGD